MWVILLVFAASGCGNSLPDSLGPTQEILVLADAAEWASMEGLVRETFEKVIHTPQEERTYSLHFGSMEHFEHFSRRKNILIIAPLDATHETARFLRSIVSPEAAEAVRAGTPLAWWKEDVWANEQLLMVVTGRDLATVEEKLRLEADRLYRAVETARNKRIGRLVYRYGERKDVTTQLATAYGWSIRVPFGYRIMESQPDSGFVLLVKEQPNRWFFVYWEDGIPPDRLTDEWCIQKRDEITERFFGGDRIAPGEVEVSQCEFAGKLAVSVRGLWENTELWSGGPFRSYAFVDVDLDRFFFVDVGIFSPNKNKEPYLRQVDLMAQTFMLGDVRYDR